VVCPVVLGRPPNRRWYEFHGERDWRPAAEAALYRPPPLAGRKDDRTLAKRKKARFKPPDTFKRMRMP
jgi:hypothetical protein